MRMLQMARGLKHPLAGKAVVARCRDLALRQGTAAARSSYVLGMMYREGAADMGVKQNDADAAFWFGHVHALGDLRGGYQMALLTRAQSEAGALDADVQERACSLLETGIAQAEQAVGMLVAGGEQPLGTWRALLHSWRGN
jgi:TPR repeat protein